MRRRQHGAALFDRARRASREPGEPIGTHVYTAMGPKAAGDGLRWTVVVDPERLRGGRGLETRAPTRPPTTARSRAGRQVRDEGRRGPSSRCRCRTRARRSTRSAIGPQDAVERIATLITPGASLIVSRSALQRRGTGTTTDFMVETK